MLLLSGPTAAGKNTVAQQIARQRERCAIVDFDAVRAMFVHPHLAPWDGEAGAAQLLLGVEQVCGLAHGFARAGWDVIVLDVVSETTAPLYRRLLAPLSPLLVQLLPDFTELTRRFEERGPVLSPGEFRAVYAEQVAFEGYNLRIDNTALSAEAAAAQIVARWDAARPPRDEL